MSDEPLSVLIITVDEQYYIPRILRDVLESEMVDIRGITTLSPTLGTQGLIPFIIELYRSFGPRVFAQHLGFYGKYRLMDNLNRLLGWGRPFSPKALAARNNVEYRHVDDINSSDYVSYAREVNPDVLLSVAATQKFDSTLLSVPEKCAINIHSSLLPEYRGVSPSFWTLRYDEPETGVTVHYMHDEIDTGDVIVQQSVPIRDDDTLHTLNTRVADVGSEVLLDALEQIRQGNVDATPIDAEEGSYYSMPDREDVRAFLDQEREFF